MPRVEIKGGISHTATKKPFTAPHPMPTARAAGMATPALPVDSRIPEARTPASPRMEPTERSIPPVRMTKVMPHPTIPATVICLNTLNRLATLKKLGDNMVANTQITSKISTER